MSNSSENSNPLADLLRNLPDIKMPSLDLPKIDLPKFDLPKMDVARLLGDARTNIAAFDFPKATVPT